MNDKEVLETASLKECGVLSITVKPFDTDDPLPDVPGIVIRPQGKREPVKTSTYLIFPNGTIQAVNDE